MMRIVIFTIILNIVPIFPLLEISASIFEHFELLLTCLLYFELFHKYIYTKR